MAGSVPKVALIVKPVDGGSGRIGLIECPHCGRLHFTFHLLAGARNVWCDKDESRRDIVKRVNVAVVL